MFRKKSSTRVKNRKKNRKRSKKDKTNKMPYKNSKQELLKNLRKAVMNDNLDLINALLLGKRLRNNFDSHNLLILSLQQRSPRIFCKLIEHGAPVIGFDSPNQNTLLHYAASLQDMPLLKLLLSFRVNVNAVNENKETAMHIAAKADNYEVLNLLLSRSMVNDNLVDRHGLSLFHILCMSEHSLHVKSFLQRAEDASKHLKDAVSSEELSRWSGFTAIHFATVFCRLETIKILVEYGARLDTKTSDGSSLLHLICDMNNLKMLQEAVPKNTSNLSEDLGLKMVKNIEFIMRNRVNVIKWLLQHNCAVDARDNDGNNALIRVALYEEDKSVYDFFVKYSIAHSDRYAVRVVKIFSDFKSIIMKLLFECYCTCKCVAGTCKDCLKQVLNYKNNSGLTCLHHLTTKSTLKTGTLLYTFLEDGADANVVDNNFLSPLHYAAKNNNSFFIGIVLHFGKASEQMINIDKQDNLGNTALHYACFNQINDPWLIETCVALLDCGSDISIYNNNYENVKILLTSHISMMLKEFRSEKWIPIIFRVWRHFKQLEIRNPNVDFAITNCLRLIENISHNSENNIGVRNKFIHECQLEVDNLRRHYVNNYITLYDVLIKDIDNVSRYIKNAEMTKLMVSTNLTALYPRYGIQLKARCARALERIDLMDEAMELSLQIILTMQSVPLSCLEKIFSYLNDAQLRDFAGVCKLIESESVRSNAIE